MVGKVGFNGDSVGVTLNAIKTEGVPLDFSKLPIHFALRYIVMESPNAGEAINRILRIGVASTAHFLIADSISAYGVEVSPLGNGVIPPDSDGFVLHTNHWISSAEISKSTRWLPDTVSRLKRLETLKSTVHSAEDIWEILADEEDAPVSICRSVAVGTGSDDDMETSFGVVMDLEFGMAEVVHGRSTRGKQRMMLPKTGPLGNMSNNVKRQSEWI
jgi:isopenicillin-N N-acyltransferase like protein